MSDIKDYEKWWELFQKEQKGTSPQHNMYRPVAGIEILPYFNHKKYPVITSSPAHSAVSHSFFTDDSSAEWLISLSEKLKPYDVTNIYYFKNELLNNKTINTLNKMWPKGLKACVSEHDRKPVKFDFGSQTILTTIKNLKSVLRSKNPNLWIEPGDDFLWNVSLLYGIRKYLTHDTEMKHSERWTIHIPLQKWKHSKKAEQLIPLTNQMLSMMAGGLNKCIWDVRDANEWQRSNLIYLLNIPEIIVREGNIFTHHNPLKGSQFFEELSDKIVEFIQK